jgi:uncharacterized protein with von Willebrand factor type A (vWA) domain
MSELNAGERLRRDIEATLDEKDMELDSREEALLTEACHTATLLEELQKHIDEHGAVHIDSKGVSNVSPVVVEARLARQTLQRLLGVLDIDGTGTPKSKAASAHGRRTSPHGRKGKSPYKGGR